MLKEVLAFVGSIFLFLSCGVSSIWGNIAIYVTSYLRIYSHTLTLADTSITFPLGILVATSIKALGVHLTIKYGARLTGLACVFISSLGIFISSYMTNFAGFLCCYCIYHAAVGINYLIPIMIGWNYFPQKKGLVTGLLMACYGTSISAFNLICTALLNPENDPPNMQGEDSQKYFESYIADRVPYMLQTISLISLALGLLGSLLIPDIRPDPNPKEYVSMSRIFTSRVFMILLSTAFFASCNLYLGYGLYIPGAFKNFGLTKFEDDHFISAAGALGDLLNGFFRILWSVLVDVSNFRSIFYLVLVIQLGLSSTIYLFTVNKWIYMIYIVGSYICEGTYFVMYPMVCCKIYGEKTGARVYAVICFAFGLSAVTGTLVQYYCIESMGYRMIFYIFSIFTMISMYLLWHLDEKPIYLNGSLRRSFLYRYSI